MVSNGNIRQSAHHGAHVMNADYLIIALNVAVLGFVWNLHRDVADLRERMARLEGLFEGFTCGEASPPARG